MGETVGLADAAALGDAADVLTVAVAVLVEGVAVGLGLGLEGDTHPAATRGATMSASVMSKRYFFTVMAPTCFNSQSREQRLVLRVVRSKWERSVGIGPKKARRVVACYSECQGLKTCELTEHEI